MKGLSTLRNYVITKRQTNLNCTVLRRFLFEKYSEELNKFSDLTIFFVTALIVCTVRQGRIQEEIWG